MAAGLSCSIAALLKKLHSFLQSSSFIKEHKNHVPYLTKLESALRSISNMVNHAEKKQVHPKTLSNWLEKLEDAVYDAEDVVDEILYEDTRSKLEAESQKLKSWAIRLLPSSTKQITDRSKSIREIVEVIEAIANEKYKFGFIALEAQNDLPLSASDNLPPLLDENAIYGREEDRHNIVRLLLSEDYHLDAIALVGEKGLGKTTLAQLVYNDEKVSNHFQLKPWICVGMDWDLHRITREILAAVGVSSFDGCGLDELQGKLRAYMSWKKFLLVLDDVWNLDITKWKALESSLKSGPRGSKIFVTTRRSKVAQVMHCSADYLLRPLTVGDCWSIVENSAFAGRDRSEAITLEDIGRKIVEKCDGLPLLARAIGGVLRFKKTHQEWSHVLSQLEFMSNQFFDPIFNILRLSYHHLPAMLKCCFAYCSLFPKGYEFDMEELVLLWMAEGFLEHSTLQSTEEVGAECFDGLLKRSFFIPVANSRFKMHDLVHDLAEHVANQVCSRLESNAMMESAIHQRTRHLSLLSKQYDDVDQLNFDGLSDILETKRLRTFYLINSPSDYRYCPLSPLALNAVFAIQQRLRVLSLPHFQYDELPESIAYLKNLRYLDVSDSALERLPESFCTLYYLQTLILTNCSALHVLPQGIVKLVNLRKLRIKGTGLKQMPEEMGRLTSLQSLSNVTVGHGGSSNIEEQWTVPDIRGLLSVSELQNVSSASNASAANSEVMKYLDELALGWRYNNEYLVAGQEKVPESLKPSGKLKKIQQFSSSMTETSDYELELEWIGTNKDPAEERAVKTDSELSRKLEKPSVRSYGDKDFPQRLESDGTNKSPSGKRAVLQKYRKLSGKLVKRSFGSFVVKKLPKWFKVVDRTNKKPAGQRVVLKKEVELSGKLAKPSTGSHGDKELPHVWEWDQTNNNPVGETAVLQKDLELSGMLAEPSIGSHGDKEFPRVLKWEQTNNNPAGETAELQKDLEVSEKYSSIGSYGDKEFQKCLEFYSLSKVTFLCVSDNNNFLSLPPLGQLPLLKHLRIERMGGVTSIGSEFYRQGFPFRQPFESLKTLKFEAMSLWELWITVEVEGKEFPCLQELYIINCPKLEGDLPKSLPSLIKLEIFECQQLAALLPLTSEHCVLKLENCDKVQMRTDDDQTVAPHDSPSIMHQEQDDNQEETISGEDGNQQIPSSSSDFSSMGVAQNQTVAPEVSPSTVHQEQDDNQEKPLAGEDGNLQFSSSSLNVSSMDTAELIEQPADLHVLRIEERRLSNFIVGHGGSNIKELGALPDLDGSLSVTSGNELQLEWDGINYPADEGAVEADLELSECQRPVEDDEIMSESDGEVASQYFSACMSEISSDELPLELDGTVYPSIMPQEQDDDQAVAAEVSPSIMPQEQDDDQEEPLSGEDENQPTELNSHRIERVALKMLPKKILESSSLQHLYIVDCIRLKIFPLPPSLKTLYIHNCQSLEFFQTNTVKNQDLLLEDLYLGSSCHSLKIFPLSYFPKLKALSLWDCRNLEYLSIDKKLQAELASLESLEIKNCPNFRSLLEEECQAPNLTSLVFFNCGSLKSLQWIQSFKSLQSLHINKCPVLESIPEEGLPSGLVILCISFCDKITLQRGWKLDKLQSLCHFEIEGGCLKLESFPEEGLLPTNLNSLRVSGLSNLTSLNGKGLQNLTSLRKLEIHCCNKLDTLPEHMPSSLSSLSITDCPLLNPKLQSRKGK